MTITPTIPTSLHALLTTAMGMGYKRLVVAFQPHTYSRTAKLFDRFVEELKIPEVVVLAEIYAAREQNTLGISSADLSREVPGSVYCSTLDKTADALRRLAQPGDLILTVGAGISTGRVKSCWNIRKRRQRSR